MNIRIEVLGGFQVTSDTSPRPIALRSYRRIVAYLALFINEPRSRRQIETDLDPDVDAATAHNRLRVALHTLRKQLGEGLTESAAGVQLDPKIVSVDFYEMQEKLADCANNVDERDEFEALKLLLEPLSQKLLPDIVEEWILPFQTEWSQLAIEAAMRFSKLAAEFGLQDMVLAGTDVALKHEPFDDDVWKRRLSAHAALSTEQKGLAELAVARASYRQLGGDFKADTLEMVHELREGVGRARQPASRFEPSILEFLGKALGDMIEAHPETALKIVGLEPLKTALVRFPQAAAAVYDVILEHPMERNPEWHEVMMQAILANGGLHRSRRVLDLSEELLKFSKEKNRWRIYLLRSFAFVQVREYEKGLETLDLLEANLKEFPDESAYHTMLSQRGTFLSQLGRYDEAMACHNPALEYCESTAQEFGQEKLIVVQSNIGMMHIMRDDIEAGMVYLTKAYENSVEINFERALPLLLPFIGYGWVRSGQKSQGTEAIIDGLRRTYQTRDTRAAQVGFDLACGALSYMGDPAFAAAALRWGAHWRKSERHEWSISEQQFVDRILAASPESTGSLESITEPRIVLHQVVKKMRRLAR